MGSPKKTDFNRGYQDYKNGINATGLSEDYNAGWILAYKELNNYGWDSRHKWEVGK